MERLIERISKQTATIPPAIQATLFLLPIGSDLFITKMRCARHRHQPLNCARIVLNGAVKRVPVLTGGSRNCPKRIFKANLQLSPYSEIL
jgi:hypothetical protein